MDDEGFALAETAVEILVLSLTLAALSFAVGTGLRALSLHRERVAAETQARQFERALVDSVETVSIPWFTDPAWFKAIGERGAGGAYAVTIPSRGTKGGPGFSFGTEGSDSWVISEGGVRFRLPESEVALVRNRRDRPLGVTLTTGEEELFVPFGPLPEKYE